MPSPREVGLEFHLPSAFERKRINGAFFANERYTRSMQYHASRKGHLRKGGEGGEGVVMRRSSRTQPHRTHTHTYTLALTFLNFAGQISLAIFLLRAQPPHPTNVSQSELPHQIGVFRRIGFFRLTNLDTFI